MDIIVKTVLDYVQNLEGHQNAVLAGGAVRDQILGLTPRDYDIFVPTRARKDIQAIVDQLFVDLKITGILEKTEDYYTPQDTYDNPQKISFVTEFMFEGKKIDLIGVFEENDEDFANEVTQKFDYGINMVYDNGSYVDDSNEHFQRDRGREFMTLINIKSLSELPKAMSRYDTLNERYLAQRGMFLEFRSSCLELKNAKESVKKAWGKPKYNSIPMHTLEVDVWEDEVPMPTHQATNTPWATITPQAAFNTAQAIFNPMPFNTATVTGGIDQGMTQGLEFNIITQLNQNT